jgi:hypothetical protein
VLWGAPVLETFWRHDGPTWKTHGPGVGTGDIRARVCAALEVKRLICVYFIQMFRLFVMVVLALLVAQPGTPLPIAEGIFWEAGAEAEHEDGCNEPCPGENEDGQCPPDCRFCECCPSTMTVTPAVVPRLLVQTARQGGYLPDVLQKLPSADPREIFHIPKLPTA